MKMRESLIGLGLAMLAVAGTAGAQTTVTTSGGTANTVPVFTGTSTVGNSPITVSGSNVGIGTTGPLVNLQVNSANPIIGLQDTNTWGSIVGMQVVGDGNLRLGYYSATNTLSNTVYLAKSGNVGIGTTAPYSSLSVLSVGGAWTNTEYGSNGLELFSGTTSNDYGLYMGTDKTNKLSYLQSVQWGTAFAPLVLNARGGNVGVGTTTPGQKLEVNGNFKLTSGSGGTITFQDGTVQSTAFTGVLCGGDYAESIEVTGDRTQYGPGDVLVIDADAPGKFLKSAEPYSTLVAGIYSTKPGVIGRRLTTPKSEEEVPLAMIGIVPVKVNAENGAIRTGDQLVTSSTLGYAMKGTDRGRMAGAVIGKALNKLDSGTGVIEVMVTLQ